MRAQTATTIAAASAVLLAVTLAYANHFENPFHFDDGHTVINNSYIRDLHNLGLFFTDTRTFSSLPANRVYRPIVTASLAVDYAMGHGLKPVYFQASTFFWFIVQLGLMAALFYRICNIAHPNPANRWVAMLAAGLYGLHPAIAETVNYVIQRGDVYSTLGVVAALVFYTYVPASRKSGWYLAPLVFALLSKPPAMIFPLILFAYIALFDEARPAAAAGRCLLPFVVTAFVGGLIVVMTPATFAPSTGSPYAYRITQPLVAFRYFRTFFIPDRLTADTDFAAANGIFERGAWLGFVFVLALIALVIWCSRKRRWRPAAFGLWWFLLALVPTSIFPLAEVENDHRMYFPFVGLTLAACWPIALWIYESKPLKRPAVTALSACVLLLACALIFTTRQRNAVWSSEESLWLDVTIKSPKNGRGLMNYGLTQMEKGRLLEASSYFDRAAVLVPNYPVLEINQGIVNGALNRDAAAQQHFQRAIALAPQSAEGHYFYARWLRQKDRPAAIAELEHAVRLNPDYPPARDLLMEISSERQTPEAYLNLSLAYHRAGKYQECIDAAREALKLRPDYAEAYNNIAAAFEELQMWDQAIESARTAVRIRPDFQLALNNLAWAESQRKNGAQRSPAN